jgi:hypothetical protein
MAQWLNGSMAQWLNGSMAQWLKGKMAKERRKGDWEKGR